MPIPPDPTHPKFLEGDEVLQPSSLQEDDVEGHIKARGGQPEDFRAAVSPESDGDQPEGIKTRNTDEGDDTEGHLMRL